VVATVKRVALTGGIATGKSYVRRQFESLGVPTIDSDTLARDAVAPATPGLGKVIERFGRDILDTTGTLDRRKLAALVFADPRARLDLEAIVHPEVRAATERWFAALDPGCPVAIADIPLLYEVGRDRDFDTVIVVACEPETQIRRVMERDAVSEEEARQRVAAQLPIEDKVRRADFVIRTDGSFEETDRRVVEVLRELKR
jgi:dephospho-CoA kinase